MKTVISSLVTALVMMFCSAAVLGEERPMESWTCSYKEGKGLNDLLAARDFELKQAEKAGIDLGNQFLWSLYKGDRDFDFVWQAPHDSWAAFNQRQDSIFASAQMSKAQARYDDIATCRGVMGALNVLHSRGVGTESDNYVVASNACRIKDGVSREDMVDLENHIAGIRTAMGDQAPLMTASIRMFTTGPNTPDWVTFSTYNNMTQRGDSVTTMRQMEQAQSLFRHRRTKLDCSFSLWRGQQVMGAD